jgi:cardiolipin hydrolase
MKLAALLVTGLLFISLRAGAGTNVFFSPKGGCEDQARKLVDSARQNLDIAVYSLNSPAVIAAIERAVHRGVRVRALTDRTQAFGRGNVEATRLLAALTPNFRVHSKNRIMHNKFAVSDNRTVMLGSFNWTRSAENSNDENCLVTDVSEIVQAFENRFERHLWVVNTSEKSDSILARKGIIASSRGIASKR